MLPYWAGLKHTGMARRHFDGTLKKMKKTCNVLRSPDNGYLVIGEVTRLLFIPPTYTNGSRVVYRQLKTVERSEIKECNRKPDSREKYMTNERYVEEFLANVLHRPNWLMEAWHFPRSLPITVAPLRRICVSLQGFRTLSSALDLHWNVCQLNLMECNLRLVTPVFASQQLFAPPCGRVDYMAIMTDSVTYCFIILTRK